MNDQSAARVMLWSTPRSLSTVFENCFSFVDGIQIIHEPFYMAHACGPERLQDKSSRIQVIFDAIIEKAGAMDPPGHGYDINLSTFSWVKQMLEGEYPENQVIFCKDFAMSLREIYDLLPKGYRHTFLIRNPQKMFPSWKKLWVKLLQDQSFRYEELPPYMNPPKHGFGELHDLYQYVQDEGLEKNPFIIDTDDLQKDPGSVLCQYCEALGIPYSDKLLSWEPGCGIVDTWKLADVQEQGNRLEEGGFYDVAFGSTHFLPLSAPPTRDEIDEDLLPEIDASMEYYNKMHAARIKPK